MKNAGEGWWFSLSRNEKWKITHKLIISNFHIQRKSHKNKGNKITPMDEKYLSVLDRISQLESLWLPDAHRNKIRNFDERVVNQKLSKLSAAANWKIPRKN